MLGMLEQRDERVTLNTDVTSTSERMVLPREAVARIEHVAAQPWRGLERGDHTRAQTRL